MTNYEKFCDFLTALINGGDNNITATSFRGSFLGNLSEEDSLYIWEKVLENMHKEGPPSGQNEENWLQHWFVREKDFMELKDEQYQYKDTVMQYITTYADRDFDVKDFLEENSPHWNNSLQELIEYYNEHIYALNGIGGEIPSGFPVGANEHMFKVTDIKDADAGNDYGSNYNNLSIEEQHNINDGIAWVRAWTNIDEKTYKEVRGSDAIVPVLNSKHFAQFTNDFIFKDIPKEEAERIHHIMRYGSFPDVNHDGMLNAADASQILAWENQSDPYTNEQYHILDFYGDNNPYTPAGAADMILKFYSIASGTEDKYFTWWYFLYKERYFKEGRDDDVTLEKEIIKYNEYLTSKHDYFMRLIMPEYNRRVEVEDLNRNFWVIAQTLSALSAFLFGKERPFNTVFEGVMDEACQLWENILYLWVTMQGVINKEYTQVQTVFMPIYNSEFQTYVKYDNFDQTSLDLESAGEEDKLKRRMAQVAEQYPESNLVIIPEIRSNNYKHNYYATAHYPAIYIYNRNYNTWGKIPLNILIDLTDWQYSSLYGSLKKNGDQYEYATEGAAPSSGNYFILIRPIVSVNPYYDSTTKTILLDNITGSTDKFKMELHDVAAELVGEQETIPCTITYDGSNITYDTQQTGQIPSSILINKGFYQGELISYNRYVHSTFLATIHKIWQGGVESGRTAEVKIYQGNELKGSGTFVNGTTDTLTFTLTAEDNQGSTINYRVTETEIQPQTGTDWREEWSQTPTYSDINQNNNEVTFTNTLSKVIEHNDMEFKTIRIGDFYPATFIDGTRTDIPALTKINTLEYVSGSPDRYDIATYGYGAYTLRTNGATPWTIGTADQHLIFVDYQSVAENNISVAEGSALTKDYLDYLSTQYIEYLKKNDGYFNEEQDGLYLTKFGTSFWVGADGSQWSAAIVHALVYYHYDADNQIGTAEIISHPQILDGYWTTDVNVFSNNNGSAWRRLCLQCDSLKITEINNVVDYKMGNGKLIWYDHWNDINPNWGTSQNRPRMKMDINDNGELVFSDAYSPISEKRMALKIKYNTNGSIFFIGATDQDNRIGVDRNDYRTDGPIEFIENYTNLHLNAGSTEGQACYIR